MATTPATERLDGVASALAVERRLRAAIFRPPPRLTVSEWADAYRVLSSVASAEAGRWRTARAPYQRAIMDAFSDPTISRVVVMSSAQVGKTEIVLNVLGHFIDLDPAPILVLQPNVEPMAKAFSKDRVAPMIRECPRLRSLFIESGRRESSNTLLHKAFPGGHLTVAGANSAAGLASRPIRVVLCDEVDRYPASAGDEGDPIALASKRTATFWNRKIGELSTPTIKGVSRIERSYNASDQRRYYVPCPECDHYQTLKWAQLVFDEAAYACESCGALIPETAKPGMLARGEWRAENPEGASYAAGFHLNALYSPWTTWRELIIEFREAKKSPDTLQTFVNTVLGETWEADGEIVDASTLAARRESYRAEVPLPVGILTAGVDVQRDRLEVAIKGWGAGQESWLVCHARIYGDPQRADVWERLESGYLSREWKHESGAVLKVRAACIDSGDQTQAVYAFVRPRQRRMIFATKGHSVRGKPIISRPSKANKYGVRVVPLGTDTAKDVIFPRLALLSPGTPGYCHFPMPTAEGADDEYLAQFAGEKVFIRRVKGVPVREYRQVRDRNEAIDLEVLNLAALHLLGAGVYDQLAIWADKLRTSTETQPPPEETPAQITQAPRPTFRRPSYLNSWRR